jgi:predicted enzyme related to lactoylglutathione lyase
MRTLAATRRLLAAVLFGTLLLAALGMSQAPAAPAADRIEAGRFVWRDLMTKDVAVARKFYGELFGWHFKDERRGDRPYVLARIGSDPVAGIVDVSVMPDAAPQWISFMSVDDVDQAAADARASGGQVLLEPREVGSLARAAVVADAQGAPLGLAQLRQKIFVAPDPLPNHFFWQEYLARDAAQALGFYKRLASYDSTISDTRLGVEYHVLRRGRPSAGLFQLPDTAVDVLPNWLPYVLVDDPSALAARVTALGGRILVPAAAERRNGTLVVIADPGGAPIALQKYPF